MLSPIKTTPASSFVSVAINSDARSRARILVTFSHHFKSVESIKERRAVHQPYQKTMIVQLFTTPSRPFKFTKVVASLVTR